MPACAHNNGDPAPRDNSSVVRADTRAAPPHRRLRARRPRRRRHLALPRPRRRPPDGDGHVPHGGHPGSTLTTIHPGTLPVTPSGTRHLTQAPGSTLTSTHAPYPYPVAPCIHPDTHPDVHSRHSHDIPRSRVQVPHAAATDAAGDGSDAYKMPPPEVAQFVVRPETPSISLSPNRVGPARCCSPRHRHAL
jgi:hypothetical protein